MSKFYYYIIAYTCIKVILQLQRWDQYLQKSTLMNHGISINNKISQLRQRDSWTSEQYIQFIPPSMVEYFLRLKTFSLYMYDHIGPAQTKGRNLWPNFVHSHFRNNAKLKKIFHTITYIFTIYPYWSHFRVLTLTWPRSHACHNWGESF